jgi:hypothetical protein
MVAQIGATFMIIDTNFKISPQRAMVGYHQARLLVVIPEQHLIELDYAEFTGKFFCEIPLKPYVIIQPVFY